MANQLTLEQLQKAVDGTAAAFRCRTELQPAGGEGDKVFPPTYAGAVYATEQRRVPGREDPVECVLLDSVQSQANRMEESLQQAVDDGRLVIPVIEVDFAGGDLLAEVGKVTSLQAPHRIADAILRDSLLDGQPFRKSATGQKVDSVSLANATPLYELCPTALVLGMWDSTGPKGGMGAKFARAMVSEIVGIDVVYGVKTASRIDPLQIMLQSGPLYKASSKEGIHWTLDEKLAAKEKTQAVKLGKEGKPSEANHGNVTPSVSDTDRETGLPIAGGVTVAKAEQVVVLSLPALRRLQFPLNGGKATSKVNGAGRTVLAALSLCAAALAAEKGFDLRSRCLLFPSEPLVWEVLDKPGTEPVTVSLDGETAIKLLNEAVAAAEKVGLLWNKAPLVLTPAPQLMELVRKSQELAAQQGVDAEGGE
jgi:CRISPR-associated protein Csb1